jgi:hypothetical protein
VRELSGRYGGDIKVEDLREVPAATWQELSPIVEELERRDDFDDYIGFLADAHDVNR